MTTRQRRHRPEDAIQRAIVKHYHQRGAPGVFMFAVPNGGFRRPVEAAILKATGTVAGVPDTIWIKGGQVYALELKAPGGQLTPAQEKVLVALREAGAIATHAHGLDQALHWLQARGLLKGRSPMTSRRRLPARRASMTFAIESQGLSFTVTASAFDNGELGELFITNHRAGSGAGIMASDSAIAATLALQYGCPLDVLRKALSRDARRTANGPLGAALDAICEERAL